MLADTAAEASRISILWLIPLPEVHQNWSMVSIAWLVTEPALLRKRNHDQDQASERFTKSLYVLLHVTSRFPACFVGPPGSWSLPPYQYFASADVRRGSLP